MAVFGVGESCLETIVFGLGNGGGGSTASQIPQTTSYVTQDFQPLHDLSFSCAEQIAPGAGAHLEVVNPDQPSGGCLARFEAGHQRPNGAILRHRSFG